VLLSAAMIALSAGRDPDKNQLSKESLAAAEDEVKFKILQKAEQRIKAVRLPQPPPQLSSSTWLSHCSTLKYHARCNRKFPGGMRMNHGAGIH
jgi:hypothetical protein